MPTAIWQLRADARNGLLALELRNPERLAVSFWVINTTTGDLELNNYQPPELWWVGLEAIQEGLLYLHGYGKEGFGQHRGITALNYQHKKNSWVNDSQRFYGLTPDVMLVQDLAGFPENIFLLNPQTGASIPGTVSVPEAKSMLELKEKETQYFWHIPVKYPAGHAYFTQVAQFILQKTGEVASGVIDYLEWNQYLFIGFYKVAAHAKTGYVFLIFTAAGELLTEVVLDDNLPGNSPDTFFIIKDTLILLKNKQSLVGFRL